MNWKETAGNYMAQLGHYRFDWLNKNILEPSLKEMISYLQEFDGIQALLDSFFEKEDKNFLHGQKFKNYRISIFYPGEAFIYGKDNDFLNRKFIADIKYTEKGLKIIVHYRRRGGAFLGSYNLEKEVLKDLQTEKEQNENNIYNAMIDFTENFRARDEYHELMPMEEATNPDLICGRIFYLYTEHIRHVEFTNK
jgi:hypothetical protein